MKKKTAQNNQYKLFIIYRIYIKDAWYIILDAIMSKEQTNISQEENSNNMLN